MKTLYHTIVFMHEDEYVAKCLARGWNRALARYLAQWDQGEYDDDPVPQQWGTRDEVIDVRVPHCGTYVLSINRGLGYAALQIAANSET